MAYIVYALAALVMIACVFVAFTSYNECLRKTYLWQVRIADRLEKSYNIRHDLGMRMVQRHYPLHEYKFKAQIHPDLAASDLFWSNNDVGTGGSNSLHSGFYNAEGKPYHLFDSNNYGRAFLEA